MNTIQNLLLLYAGVMLLSILLSVVLWRSERDPMFRRLALLWVSVTCCYGLQGVV